MKKAWALGLAIVTIAALMSCGIPGSAPRLANSSTPAARSEQSGDPPGKPSPSSERRGLKFSGYDWTVKFSGSRVGPGPNYFSDSNENVFVDLQGRLHLKITQRDGQWHCAEIISTRSLGYGTYRFYVEVGLDNFDPQVVLGMFTWSDAPEFNHREIDIEVSRWGRADNQNAQFVVQPYTRSQNILRFQIPSGLPASWHFFTWKPGNVFCQSMKGSDSLPASSAIIQEHTFTQDIPQAGGENARINLWLLAGHPPADKREAEVRISKFEFVPLAH